LEYVLIPEKILENMILSSEEFSGIKDHQIGHTEEDVKINFIVPWLESFGHERLSFEHHMFDILIKYPDYTILVETKKMGILMDEVTFQLEKYSKKMRIDLAIMTNCSEFFFFSPEWNTKEYEDRLLLYCQRSELADDDVNLFLESILSKEKILSGVASVTLKKREKFIEKLDKNDKNELKNNRVYYPFDRRPGYDRSIASSRTVSSSSSPKPARMDDYNGPDKERWLRSRPESVMNFTEKILDISRQLYPGLEVKYHKYYITAKARKNIYWLYPSKTGTHCTLEFREANDKIKSHISSFEERGIECKHTKWEIYKVFMRLDQYEGNEDLVEDAIRTSIDYN
jgi:hypothetical protein